MDRREALRQVAWLMGGAISAPALVGVLNGCSPKQSVGWKPVLLSDAQAALVTAVAELIIPRTSTPGAEDVGVPAFIDLMLRDAYPKEDQDRYLDGLKSLQDTAQKAHGKPFLQLHAEHQLALLRAIHDEAVAAERELLQLHSSLSPALLQRPFILMTKELSLLGFFMSQVGATQVLQYVAVPGSFEACVPIEAAGNGKNWSVETSTRF